jgi:hypothetical protein
LRKTEKFNKCDLIWKSSVWVGAVPFMKRVNQIEGVKKTICYYWDNAGTSYTVFYPTFLPVHKILGTSVGSEAIINQLLVRKSAVFLGCNHDIPYSLQMDVSK